MSLCEMSVGWGLKHSMSQSNMILSIFIILSSLSLHTEFCFHIFEVSYLMLIFGDECRSLSCVLTLRPHGLYSSWNSPGQNPGVGSLSLLQGIFPARELNRGLLHCRRILYQLNYEGSPISGKGFPKGFIT